MSGAERVGFFGPFGTFTQQALLSQPDLAEAEHVAYRTVPDVLDAVEQGEVDVGVVPIENSIEGMVNFTQDALAFDHDLLIQREIVIDIEHCLLAKPGVTLADVTETTDHRNLAGRHHVCSALDAIYEAFATAV